MDMTRDQEHWAEALQVEKQHGDNAALFIVSRLEALVAANDAAGMRRWADIALRYLELVGVNGKPVLAH